MASGVTVRRTATALKRLSDLAPLVVGTDAAIQAIVDTVLYPDAAGPPTNLELIAERLGVSSIQYEELVIAGYTVREGGDFHITLDSCSLPTRSRFTLAHELGHVFLERQWPAPPRPSKVLEDVCDRFAAYLLMPDVEFTAATKDLRSVRDLRRVARTFGASLTATVVRYAELNKATAIDIVDGHMNWSVPRNIDPSNIPVPTGEGQSVFNGSVGGIFSRWTIDVVRLESESHLLGLIRRTREADALSGD